jgi:hypothetical protein
MKTIAKQLVLISIGAFLLTSCTTMHKTHAYEYKTYNSLNTSSEAELNKLGKEGWVLVGFTYVPAKQTDRGSDEFHYVFVRHEK